MSWGLLMSPTNSLTIDREAPIVRDKAGWGKLEIELERIAMDVWVVDCSMVSEIVRSG